MVYVLNDIVDATSMAEFREDLIRLNETMSLTVSKKCKWIWVYVSLTHFDGTCYDAQGNVGPDCKLFTYYQSKHLVGSIH